MAKSSFVERNRAVRKAWIKEQELVQGGKGTREWTPEQQKDILEKGRAYDENRKAFEGQHMKSAEMYPEYQGDPGNIQFLTRVEHLEAHDGNWRNPTNWFFNPITKKKTDFGDEKYIPCKIIQLAEPLIKTQIEQNESRPASQVAFNETQSKKQQSVKNEPPQKTVTLKNNDVKNKKAPGFDQKLRQGLKMIGKTIIEFPEKHPTALKVIKGIGIAAATITAVAEVSKRGSSGSGDEKSDDYNFDESEDSYDDYSADDDSQEDTESSYTPNDVPAGGQHYHYKDGSVRWKEKPPYHRGGDE